MQLGVGATDARLRAGAIRVCLIAAAVLVISPIAAQPAAPEPGNEAGPPPDDAGDETTGDETTGDDSDDASTEDGTTGGPSPEALAEAKQLFAEGQALRKAGDCSRAARLFLHSRALVPGRGNTLNAALCLAQIDRGDEALVLFRALLAEQGDQLDARETQAVTQQIADLEATTGELEVIDGPAGATLVIDGVDRGTLPLAAPIPVSAGVRDVRVMMDGYEPYVAPMELQARKSHQLVARMTLLTRAGRLELRHPDLTGGVVYVDGAPVGHLPFDGALEPGEHVLQIHKWDVGTAPQSVTVVAGQTARIELDPRQLGPELTLTTTPEDAAVSIADVVVGTGKWRGRLPVGEWSLRATREGYDDATAEYRATIDGRAAKVALTLEIDESHPLWDTPLGGQFYLDLAGGPALAPTLASGAEASCASHPCSDSNIGFGGFGFVRAGFELPSRLGFELVGGFMSVSKDLSRQLGGSFTTRADEQVSTQYDVNDSLTLRGGFAGGGLGYRLTLVGALELRGHLALGAAFLRASHGRSGTASAGSSVAPIDVADEGTQTAVDLLVLPELSLGARLDAAFIGVGVSAAVLALGGPTNDPGDAYVRGSCDPDVDATAVACAPGAMLFTDEASYGTTVVVVPFAQAGYLFE